MYPKGRTCNGYLTRLKSFIIVAEAAKSNQRKSGIWCPCVNCENVLQFRSALDVYAHLIIRGFMADYKYWNKHGEGGLNDQDLQDAGRMGHQYWSEDLISEQQQNTKDGDEGPPDSQGCEGNWDSQTARHDDLSEDELVDIGDNYVDITNKMEEMVRDPGGGSLLTLVENPPLVPIGKTLYL